VRACAACVCAFAACMSVFEVGWGGPVSVFVVCVCVRVRVCVCLSLYVCVYAFVP